ncbi:hypothetical protein [Marinicellulosiphila megalodicopiae]|uniref:hypothetical protein n=1 Tax=Marinicellulosiphila megalodicopiae TaxID=2724896 RepID=UPI003BB06961
MKLGITKTENDLREELTKSYESLLNDVSNFRLRTELKKFYPDFKCGCILHNIHEQYEDIYVVLVNDFKIISIELSRVDLTIDPIIEFIELSKYKSGLKKSKKIKLAIATEIVENGMK